MSTELKEMLRSILQEELADIRTDLQELKTGQKQLEQRQEKLEQRQEKLEQKQESFDTKLDNFMIELRSGFKYLEATIKEHRVVIDLIQRGEKPEIN
jgi:peptidoglycan hydrolase CwlO-like protein